MTGIYARWHMFDEKREAMMAIETAVLPLMPAPGGFGGLRRAPSPWPPQIAATIIELARTAP